MSMKEMLLAHTKIMTSNHPNVLQSITVEQFLFDEKLFQLFFTRFGQEACTISDDATATFIANQLGYFIAGFHLLMLEENNTIEKDFTSFSLQLVGEGAFPSLFFTLKTGKGWPLVETIEERQKEITAFYSETMSPMLLQLAKAGNTPVAHLWKQAYGIMTWIFEQYESMASEENKRAIKEDIEYITNKQTVLPFLLKKNPLHFKWIYIDNPWRPSEQLRMKPTCCKYYKTTQQPGYCYTCPIMKKEEREKKREEIIASLHET